MASRRARRPSDDNGSKASRHRGTESSNRRATPREDSTTRRLEDAEPPSLVPPQSRRAFLLQALLVFAVTVAAHSSSLWNHYALDDQLLIQRNVSVLRGLAGLGEIFTSHIYESYFESVQGDALPANRHYRPVLVLTFALEQSLFGPTLGDEYRALRDEWNNPPANANPAEIERRLVEMERRIDRAHLDIAFERHVVNILLDAGSMIVLLLFLQRCIFPTVPLAGLIATILFALHPIHTEVVANLKSRDEILSLGFIAATGIFVFEWDRTRKRSALIWALVCLTLGLLSKEYPVVAPGVIGAALMLVRRRSFRAALMSVLPLLIPIVLYLMVRQAVIGPAGEAPAGPVDLIVDPYAKIRTGEAEGSIAATKIDILDHNLWLLFWPHPLSADYSYAAFSYRTFADWQVWASLLAYAAIIALTLLAWRRRHVLAYAGIVYLGFTALVQIGAGLGDRLAYHSSLGFVILLGWLIAKLPRVAAVAVCVAVAVPYGVLSFQRDRAWKDDRTLFMADVKTVPRATLVNGKLGSAILNDALTLMSERSRNKQPLTPADRELVRRRAAEALVYLKRSVAVHPTYAGAWVSIGTAHYYREEWGPAADAFARAAEIYPGLPALRQYAANFHLLGTTLARSGDLAGATEMFRRAAATNPDDIRYQTAYAAAAFMALKFGEARAAFAKATELDPNNPQAQQGFAAARAYDELTKATVERPNDPEAFEQLAEALSRNPGFAAAAERARATARRLRE